jgi:rod shape-determining protein MreD
MTQSRVSWLAVFLSFAGAAVFELLVMPQAMLFLRPEWMVLTLIYWLLRHPERIGLLTAFVVGLVMDVISGSYLGVHIIACCVISYLVLTMHQRLKMFPVLQQSLVIFFIISIVLMIVLTIRASLGVADNSLAYLWAAASSAVVWPFVLIFTDRLVFALR